MTFTGSVVQVATEYAGAVLSDDVSAGASELPLDTVAALPPTGTLRISFLDPDTGDEATEEVDYTAVDADTLAVTLDGTTTNAYPAEADVLVLPLAPTTRASVNYSEDFPPIDAFVPENFKTTYKSVFNDGEYDLGTGAEVTVDDIAGAPTIVKVLRVPSVLDGASIDPDTTIPPGALTDGEPPASSPTPVLEPFAIGALRWSVTPVANADPVRFRVYADTVDPPTIDAAHLVADTGSLHGVFDEIDGVALLPDSPIDTVPTYYVACVEYDADGEAATSATSVGAQPRRAGVAEISAGWVYAGGIQANQVLAGTFIADLALAQRLAVGGYIDIDGNTSSITIYGDVEHTQPLVQLKPDGSVFRGQVIADDVSVLNGLILQGTGSHIAVDAGLTLDNGVIDPTTAPTLSITPGILAFPAEPSGWWTRGFSWDATDSRWLRMITNGSAVKVQRISGTPLAVASEVTLSPTVDAYHTTLTRIGSNYFTVGFGSAPSGNPRVYKWNATTGAFVAKSAQVSGGHYGAAVGSDGSDLVLAVGTLGAVEVFSVDPSALTMASIGYATATAVSAILLGSFDFGAERVVIVDADYSGGAVSHSTGPLAHESTEDFPSAAHLAWNGSNFFGYSGGTTLHQYGDYYPASGENAYVAYADADAPSHTAISPLASVALEARRYVLAVLPPAPTSAPDPRVYMAIDTTTPANTDLLLRPEAMAGRYVGINPSTAGGTALVRTATVTNKALTSNVATLTTSAAHNLEVGDTITVASVDATFNGTYTITAVGSSTTLSYAKTASNVASTASGGTITNTDTNTFGDGTPGWIKSELPGWELHGDGAAVFEPDILTKSQQVATSAGATPNGTANTTLTHSTLTMPSRGVDDVFWVHCNPDIAVTSQVNIIEMLIDGVVTGAQLITGNGTASSVRSSPIKRWRVTGLAAGDHAVTFRTRNTAAGTGATVNAGSLVGWEWAQ